MKLISVIAASKDGSVASRIGAWIETTDLLASSAVSSVASRIGAWIETYD